MSHIALQLLGFAGDLFLVGGGALFGAFFASRFAARRCARSHVAAVRHQFSGIIRAPMPLVLTPEKMARAEGIYPLVCDAMRDGTSIEEFRRRVDAAIDAGALAR